MINDELASNSWTSFNISFLNFIKPLNNFSLLSSRYPDCTLNQLPDDILYEIFKYLNKRSKLLITECCRRFYNLVAESQTLMEDLVPTLDVYVLAQKSYDFKAISSTNRKYKRCKFTGTMTYKTMKKFVAPQVRNSLKIIEFCNLSLNFPTFWMLLESFPNLEEISFENIQIEGLLPKNEFCIKNLKKLTLNAVECEDTLLKLVNSWTNLETMRIQNYCQVYNILICNQNCLKNLEVDDINYDFMDGCWNELVRFQLKSLNSKYVLDNEYLIDFLDTQKELESLNLVLTVELDKNEFKKLLEILFRQEKLHTLSFMFHELSNFEDLSFFHNCKSNIKYLMLGTYSKHESLNKSDLIANFLNSVPLVETLNLQTNAISLTEHVAHVINHMEYLKTIIIGECSDELLRELRFTKVQSIEINSFRGLSEDWFKFFNNNQKIKELKILSATETSFLDDKAYKQMLSLKNLENLEITVPNYVIIRSFLENFKKLKRLYFQPADRNLNLDPDFTSFVRLNKYKMSREFWFLKLTRSIVE